MNVDYKTQLQKANDIMLTGQQAARATLEEVKNAFPQCAAITNQAEAVCRKLVKQYRTTFDSTVENLFITMSKSNTLIK